MFYRARSLSREGSLSRRGFWGRGLLCPDGVSVHGGFSDRKTSRIVTMTNLLFLFLLECILVLIKFSFLLIFCFFFGTYQPKGSFTLSQRDVTSWWLLLEIECGGGCLVRGMCLLPGGSWSGGYLLPGGCLLRGGAWSGGVPAPGGVVSHHALRQTPPSLWTESQTGVKT